MTIIEALHDMSRPVDALSAARQILAQDGTLLVVDGLVNDEFTAPASPRERTEYGWSVVSCLPGAMADPQTAATGAVMRPSVLRQYALQAGFSDVQTLPIDTDVSTDCSHEMTRSFPSVEPASTRVDGCRRRACLRHERTSIW